MLFNLDYCIKLIGLFTYFEFNFCISNQLNLIVIIILISNIC